MNLAVVAVAVVVVVVVVRWLFFWISGNKIVQIFSFCLFTDVETVFNVKPSDLTAYLRSGMSLGVSVVLLHSSFG